MDFPGEQVIEFIREYWIWFAAFAFFAVCFSPFWLWWLDVRQYRRKQKLGTDLTGQQYVRWVEDRTTKGMRK